MKQCADKLKRVVDDAVKHRDESGQSEREDREPREDVHHEGDHKDVELRRRSRERGEPCIDQQDAT